MDQKKKILLVEDNEMNRDMLTRRLSMRGFEVVTSVDGGEAVTSALTHLPDIILMDLSLPVVDGIEATTQIKGHPKTKSIPIIALTAHVNDEYRHKAKDAGCEDYDTKPIDLNRLLGKIDVLLTKTGEKD